MPHVLSVQTVLGFGCSDGSGWCGGREGVPLSPSPVCSPNVVWGNQDPMWPVSQAALQAEPSSRLEELARPKQSHRDEHCYM